MNDRTEIRVRRSIAWRKRIALGLIGTGGLAFSLSHRPIVPDWPWAAIQPTLTDEVRETAVFALWLLVIAVCVALDWIACRPPRIEETVEYPPANWLPPPTNNQHIRRSPPPSDLLALFAAPRLRLEPAGSNDHADRSIEATDQPPARPGSSPLPTEPDVAGALMLRLFGRLRIDDSGRNGLSQRATRGLIAYLALKRGPATMDELLEALWPGEAPTITQHRFWKAGRQAQQLLGEALVRGRDGYELDRTRLKTDTDELERRFTNQLTADSLEEALSLAEGEPLADTDYPWADNERRRLRAVQLEFLEQTAAALLDKNDPSTALAIAEQLIALDPLNEHGWRLAMEAEGALGHRQAILTRFEQLSQQLDESLGLRPSNEVKATYHRLLSQN
jgi:DNA-binding SARP family transcriptional activator